MKEFLLSTGLLLVCVMAFRPQGDAETSAPAEPEAQAACEDLGTADPRAVALKR